jgi:hypothetical protein
MQGLRRISDRRRTGLLVTTLGLAALACAPGVQARKDAPTATFRVTLNAQLTKTWDYVATRRASSCTITDRVRGSRTVTLTSARPTIVRVVPAGGRVRFTSPVLRFVTARARQGGSVDATQRGTDCVPVTDRDCAPLRRTLTNRTLRFFRSGNNELSFRRAPGFGTFPTTCPPEAPEIRAENPRLHEAEGRLDEKDLFNRAITTVTAGGTVQETIEIEGEPTGKVVTRVSWTLTFRRL